jgi:hypothetical protein
MKRRALLALLASGCGDPMFARRPGRYHAPSGFPGGVPAPAAAAFPQWDLRGLSSADRLLAWWDASEGVTMSGTPIASGTAPPVVTFSGTLTGAAGKAIYIQTNKSNAAQFDWGDRNGWGMVRVADFPGGELGQGAVGVTIPQGSSIALGTTGITAHFPVGTYNTSQVWQAAAARIDPIVGGASMALDNSSVYASKGQVIGGPQFFNDCRPALMCAPNIGAGGLGHVGGLADHMTGLNKPFHLFLVCQITQTNISTLSVCPWGFSDSDATTTANANYLDWRWFGPDSGNPRHLIQRHADGGGAAVQASYSTALGFDPVILECSYEGAGGLVEGFINGLPMFSASWTSGALDLHRFMIGAQKFGTLATANIPYFAWQAAACYRDKLTAAEARAVRRALS